MPELQWGQTPWDNLTREELLREVQRMYAAVQSLYSEITVRKEMKPDSVYFAPDGAGGRAWERGHQIVEPLVEQYGDQVYRAFFHYATDLLFEPSAYHQPQRVICPECGEMWGGDTATFGLGKVHKFVEGRGECNGVLRRLKWADLHPERWTGG
ncbi:MAG: hypothetical protein KJ077_11165 [Anaerolineae bacterium]|nr:hypothetical protein [Anaerolineae bacterium]